MCGRIAEHLKPGGRFVGTIPNPEYDRHQPHDERYGGTMDWPHDMVDGDAYAFTLHFADPPMTLQNYYWSRPAMTRALESSGIHNVTFRPWLPTSEGIQHLGAHFWKSWISNPGLTVVSGVRSAM